jgi:hypothetical protein
MVLKRLTFSRPTRFFYHPKLHSEVFCKFEKVIMLNYFLIDGQAQSVNCPVATVAGLSSPDSRTSLVKGKAIPSLILFSPAKIDTNGLGRSNPAMRRQRHI